MNRIVIAILLAITCAAVAQNADAGGRPAQLVWQPPQLDFPHTLPPPTVPKVMISTFRLADMQIVLEETTLNDVHKRLGAVVGQQGDASTALQWLCFYGSDADGTWALWIESGEMGGGTVDGLALQRLDRNAKPDRRCRMLQEGDGGFDLPISVRLGMTEIQVRDAQGKPTLKYRNTMIFNHEHQESIRNEPYTATNTVAAALRRGVVWAIEVWKVTSN